MSTRIQHTPSSSSLHIEYLPSDAENYTVFIDRMKEWNALAEKDPGSSIAKKKLENSKKITQLIINNIIPNKDHFQVYLCKDAEDRTQGVAVTQKTKTMNNLALHCLLTHPHNLYSDRTEEKPPQIRGVGTALINHVFHSCLEKNLNGIVLSALSGTRSFYTKRQFVSLNGKTAFMAISKDKIKSVLTGTESEASDSSCLGKRTRKETSF